MYQLIFRNSHSQRRDEIYRSIVRTQLFSFKLHYHDASFLSLTVYMRGIENYIHFSRCISEQSMLHARAVTLSPVARMFLFLSSDTTCHTCPLHTRTLFAGTLFYIKPETERETQSPGRCYCPCVSSSSLGFRTEMRHDGVTRPSAYRSYALALQRNTSRGTSHFNDHFDTSPERTSSVSRTPPRQIVRDHIRATDGCARDATMTEKKNKTKKNDRFDRD